jgi:hypothetical protein
MSYQVFYIECSDKRTSDQLLEEHLAKEHFDTEHRALARARELLEDCYHHTVSVRYQSGDVLSGLRLQLKVGFGRASE